MTQFHLQIVTPDGLVFDGMADSILVRADLGEIEIMKNHVDYFAALGIGRAKLVVDGKESLASAAGGFVSVKGGEVKLICTTFEFKDNIDVERAIAAKEKAENAIKNANDDKAITIAKAKLARAINRINVAQMK